MNAGPVDHDLDLEVVVPVRWDGAVDDRTDRDFTHHLSRLATLCDVTVVDGSQGPEADERRHRWSSCARVLRPDPRWHGPNGKVSGAVTGVVAARHPKVVIADDDVRHDESTLRALAAALDDADLVIPQNHPTRWPWWAWWESGRALLNRAVATDWPGTLAVRREVVVATGGWAADVLFENLEMARTVRGHGGLVLRRRDILVARVPPTARHFLRQRVRQAYEDQAQPARLALSLAVVPTVLLVRRRPWALAGLAGALVAVAEVGRRRQGGASVFPWFTSVAAPLWALERGACAWLGLLARCRGGIRYHGTRMSVAAHRTPPGGPRPDRPRSAATTGAPDR